MHRTGIEIIGMISTTLASEIYGKSIITGAVDPRFIADFARAHEAGGFDRVLVGYGSTGADGFVVAAHAAGATTRLGFLIAPLSFERARSRKRRCTRISTGQTKL